MTKENCMERLTETGVIAIMRARTSDQLLKAADAIKAGGVNAIEVTMTTPNALDVISKAVALYGSKVMFGVGSVLDPESAREAILAGAQFVVVGKDDVVILKTIESPSMRDFDSLIAKARRQARASGMKRSDVARAIRRVRGR